MAKNPRLARPSMVSDPLTDGWYVGHPITIDPMLIACPNCSTSYMIDPASLGEAGRTVRCARCKTTWFASKPEMASAGTDDDPTSAIGVIRPDQRIEDRVEGTAAEEQVTGAATQVERAALVAMDCTCSCPLRLQRCAGRRPQRGCEVLPADRLVIRGGRPAGQPASPEIREHADFKRNAGRTVGSGDRRHHRQRRRQGHRGATTALRCTRRIRTGNLYLERLARPQHSRAWRKT